MNDDYDENCYLYYNNKFVAQMMIFDSSNNPIPYQYRKISDADSVCVGFDTTQSYLSDETLFEIMTLYIQSFTPRIYRKEHAERLLNKLLNDYKSTGIGRVIESDILYELIFEDGLYIISVTAQ